MSDIIEMEQAPQRSVAMAATPADLVRYALDSNADLAKIEKLMDMQERYEANQARKAYVVAMADFKRNAPDIYKDKNVSFTGTSYNHASLGGICDVVIEALANHGISHRWDTNQPDSGMIVVKCILTHVLGHSESTQMSAPPDNSGKKNGIQQIASTMSYLQRYTLLAACGLAAKDMPDNDGHGAEQEKEKSPVAKKLFSQNGFNLAIEAIRKKEYTAAQIRNAYELTVDQETAIADAEKEVA